MSVTFKDNSKQVLAVMDKSIEAALTKIGIAAKHNVQTVIVEKDIYDTGELHRTIDYEVHTDKQSVDIGSPKNYAVFNELGTVKLPERPFIRPGILNNIGEYKDITAEVLGSSFDVSAGGLSTKSKYYSDDERVTNI